MSYRLCKCPFDGSIYTNLNGNGGDFFCKKCKLLRYTRTEFNIYVFKNNIIQCECDDIVNDNFKNCEKCLLENRLTQRQLDELFKDDIYINDDQKSPEPTQPPPPPPPLLRTNSINIVNEKEEEEEEYEYEYKFCCCCCFFK